MAKRAWLYVNSPSGSAQMLVRQLNQLVGYAKRKDCVIVGLTVDAISRKRDFYEADGTSKEIIEAATEGRFDILLLKNTKLITPENGWNYLVDFNRKLNDYGVQMFDMVIQDQPLKDTLGQFTERYSGYGVFHARANNETNELQPGHYPSEIMQIGKW